WGLVAFVLGGLVKGTLGVGLPLVVVPLMSLVVPSPTAIALVSVPVVVSNAVQCWQATPATRQAKRFAPLIFWLVLATVVTVPMTLALSAKALNAMLAGAVLLAVVTMAWNPQLHIQPQYERRVSAGVGLVSGLLGGVSSLTGPVIITYLMSLRLERDQFVGTISLVYLWAMLPLYVAMAVVGRLGVQELGLSVVACGPMFVGMWLGRHLRGHLSEALFRRLLLMFLSLLACGLLLK
ncbi:MAG: hypothetical protein RLZZ126_798, partial [Pseudomonadota bacterium]